MDITPALAAAGERVPFSVSLDAARASREDVSVGEALLSGHMAAEDGRIVLEGVAKAQMTAVCARCARRFDVALEAPFQQVYHREEIPDDQDAQEDAEHITGYEIDLEALAVPVLALHMPYRYLCAQMCKGLCPQCGQDLNEGACECDSMGEGSPFAVLKTLFNEEKEVDPHGSTQG